MRRRPSVRRAALALTLMFVLVAGPFVALVAAHNPALTVYAPAPLDGGLLVLGGEGTAALLTPDGGERWTTDGLGSVVQAPVALADGSAAATLSRSLEDGELRVLGFDAQGPTWTVPLPGADGAFVAVAGPGDGFAVFTLDGPQGNLSYVSAEGDVTREHQLTSSPDAPGGGVATAPARMPVLAPDGGWTFIGRADQLVAVDPDGRVVDAVQLDGTGTGLATWDGHVAVAVRGPGRNEATVHVFHRPSAPGQSFEAVASWTLDGFLIGGAPALVAVDDQAHPDLFVGTYLPAGSRVAGLRWSPDDGPGHPTMTGWWEDRLENDTASAATASGDRVVVTANSAVYAYTAQGQRLWQAPAEPTISAASIVGGIVLPPGANNNLTALSLEAGDELWRWSDGVRTVPWTDEAVRAGGGVDPAGSDDPEDAGDRQPRPTPLAPWLVLVAATLAALGAMQARHQPRP